MGRNNYFQFKQFKIVQEKSAMKVGTDGVLLGAWSSVEKAKTVLDIGTGTGLISLMMAQRSGARVTGIEIEKLAANEAVDNIINSKWKDRISIENISFQDFVNNTQNTFDLIVSNPPFFSDSFKNEIQNRAIARHNHLLSFHELVRGSVKLLNENGLFSVVLPNIEANKFINLAKHEGLNLTRRTDIKPKASKSANRCLMEFAKKQSIPEISALIIYNEDNSDFTEDYKQLTRDFYLNF